MKIIKGLVIVKLFKLIALSVVFVVLLAGCGSGISQAEYDVVVAQRDELLAREIDAIQSEQALINSAAHQKDLKTGITSDDYVNAFLAKMAERGFDLEPGEFTAPHEYNGKIYSIVSDSISFVFTLDEGEKNIESAFCMFTFGLDDDEPELQSDFESMLNIVRAELKLQRTIEAMASLANAKMGKLETADIVASALRHREEGYHYNTSRSGVGYSFGDNGDGALGFLTRLEAD